MVSDVLMAALQVSGHAARGSLILHRVLPTEATAELEFNEVLGKLFVLSPSLLSIMSARITHAHTHTHTHMHNTHSMTISGKKENHTELAVCHTYCVTVNQ